MATYLEAWEPGGARFVALAGERSTVGRAETNDILLVDRRVSAVHAVLERLGPHWFLRDVGSRNGTWVNGERLVGERILQPGDEIRMGDTRLVYRAEPSKSSFTTEGAKPPPPLTRREREVLVALCRPVAAATLVTEPASVADVAAELVLSESAVKQHVANLYDKFGLYGEDRRRGRLAGEAIARGAVRLADLHPGH